MLMQKQSPNKVLENDDINVNGVDCVHSNGVLVTGRNGSIAGSDCNEDVEGCSSDEESHNTEQENQASVLDGKDNIKSCLKKKKVKAVKVKFAGSQNEDKTGIKLKIRRTNNFNQDENHVIVDNVEQHRKRHLKNKRCKGQEGSMRIKTEESVASDDNGGHKRCKTESEDESRSSVAINTASKGTEMEDVNLGPCQAGTRLSLESVVMMETKSGILIVSVQWRGKTLMGALMESERFQIGSLEKDSIYRRDKMIGLNRRNTRRKSKNLFGKKKRKLTSPPLDSGEHGGTENEAYNSDVDNPYMCDKDSCHMRFADFQTLRIHIYQKHRVKCEGVVKMSPSNEPSTRSSLLNRLHSSVIDTKPSIPDLVSQKPSSDHANVTTQSSEERNTFSPAYSDISDANEAPVLENEAELKPSSISVPQPPINLSLCQNATLIAASNRMIFSPTAPALQPEVNICASQQVPTLRMSHEVKLPQITNYRYPITDSSLINGFIQGLPNNLKQQNCALSLTSASNLPSSQSIDHSTNSIQDLSINSSLGINNLNKYPHKHPESNNHHKTAPSRLNCHKPVVSRNQDHMHQSHHHNIHSNNPSLTNGLTNNHNSKHSLSLETPQPNQLPPNGVSLSQLPFMSFSPSVNNQNSKLSYPINMYRQSKY